MKLRCIFAERMRKTHRQAVLLGETVASSPEEFFGFHHEQVESIHVHLLGVGRGTWFRLNCGLVVDEVARPAPRNLELYA